MKLYTIPNLLTFFRILLIPIFVIIFFLPFNGNNVIVAILFLLAAVTDWLDGFLARRLQQLSPFGAFLDPVADKLMVAAALILLVLAYPYWWMALAGIIIVSREIVISALREWMAEMGERAAVKVSMIGKVKTTLQMLALLLLLLEAPYYNLVTLLGFILVWVAAVLTLWSMCIYLKAAWVSITQKESADQNDTNDQ